jgi:hypothetical protein
MLGDPALPDRRHLGDLLDMDALMGAHGLAGFPDGDVDALAPEAFDEGDRRGQAAEIEHGARPIEDGRLKLAAIAALIGEGHVGIPGVREFGSGDGRGFGGGAAGHPQLAHHLGDGGERALHLRLAQPADAADAEAVGDGELAG